MGMFDTAGKDSGKERKASTLKKLERMKMTLSGREPDRVPVSDFFWGAFVRRWRKDLGLADDASPYYHYNLDWIVTVPNMDPFIRSFETIKEDDTEVVVKTGFGAIMRKKFDFPMPEFIGFDTDTIEKLEALAFDDAYDKRRYYQAGDNQIAGVGDGFERNSPAWTETVKSLYPDFPVFGICMGHQIIAHALGGSTEKLKFGHRGGNQPVKNIETGYVAITSQNHGFAAENASLEACGAIVTEYNLNDQTVAGLRHKDWPVFSVQYHPEASPGPHDSDPLFDHFYKLVDENQAK